MSNDHVNFCCTVNDLESPRVKLTPFVPSQHAQIFFDASERHPQLYRYLPFGPFETTADFVQWQDLRIRNDASNVLFAVLDKTHPGPEGDVGAFAGMIGLLDMSPSQASTEIGFLVTLPHFQRSHVTATAIGLLLRYCLDLPARGGLGLRRVQWKANAENAASIRAAEKVGFVREGLLRWHWVLPPGKTGKKSRDGDPVGGAGRDTVILAICWDDWEAKRSAIDALIEQVS